jgi:hypothetical protein
LNLLKRLDWGHSYLNPYDENQTYYQLVKAIKDIKQLIPKSYHFGADAHQIWANHLTKIINESIMFK